MDHIHATQLSRQHEGYAGALFPAAARLQAEAAAEVAAARRQAAALQDALAAERESRALLEERLKTAFMKGVWAGQHSWGAAALGAVKWGAHFCSW